jgi:hypothetical protein
MAAPKTPKESAPQPGPDRQVPTQAADAAKTAPIRNAPRPPPRGRSVHPGVRRAPTSTRVPKRGRLSHGAYMANTAFNEGVTRRAQLSDFLQSVVAEQNRLARALIDGEYGGTDYVEDCVPVEGEIPDYEADGEEE